MSRSQSKAEYGRYAHLFVGGIEWLLSQWQALTGGAETDLHSHAASGGGSLPVLAYEVWNTTLTDGASGVYPSVADGADAQVLRNDSFVRVPANVGYLAPLAGVYLVNVRWQPSQHATLWTMQRASSNVMLGSSPAAFPWPPQSVVAPGSGHYLSACFLGVYGLSDFIGVAFTSFGADATIEDAIIEAVYLGPAAA